MHKLLRGVALVIALSAPPVLGAGKTELETTAARLKPGEWAELKTKNFSRDLLDTPGSFITAFSDEAIWNPLTRGLYYLGAGHGPESGGVQTRFIRYSAADNFWSVIKLPEELYDLGHSYDHSAIDPAAGAMYHRMYGSKRQVYRYDFASDKWNLLPLLPRDYYFSITGGLEYFPELGGLVHINGSGKKDGDSGSALVFKNGKWSALASGLSFGDYHTFSEYNPVHGVLVFGGGEWHMQGDSNKIFKVDAAGKVSKLKDAPLDLGTHETVFTVDPVSGMYLVFGSDRSFWEFDVVQDRWRKLQTSVPVFTDTSKDNPVQGTIASPIADHGVVIFVSYFARKVYLYKHR